MWLLSDMWWMCLSFLKMAGRRSALQWRKLARQNFLRGRAARYVAAAALWLVAACGCCLALLLPLTMLLGVLAAVLLPSFLRCVQLRNLHGLLRQEALLLEFVQCVPYYCVGIENPDDIAVPWLHAHTRLLGMLIRLLVVSEWTCCKGAVYRSCVGFPFWAVPRWSVDAFFCNFRVQAGDDGGTILLFLLDGCFFPCAPEVLFGMTILFARHLGLHAESNWTCQRYTFMLVMMFCNGILSKIGWTTSWRCPVWFVLLGFSYYHPLFPPKKKSDAEKADIVRAELEQFVAEHGQMPLQHADLISSRSLYAKLKKLKLLHLLKHDWRRGVCDDTLKFFDLHGRIPRRQNMTTDEQRAEDALAQRWDRLLAQKASLPNKLLNEYHQLFAAAEMEVDDGHLAVCVAVSEFFETTRRCRSGKWGTVTRSEQRMRLLSVGIALWLRRRQWAKTCCHTTVLSLVRPRWK